MLCKECNVNMVIVVPDITSSGIIGPFGALTSLSLNWKYWVNLLFVPAGSSWNLNRENQEEKN